MSNYTPKTRLEKILMGVEITARSGLEKAVKAAMASIASAVELPVVSSTHNGKVLKVSGGKWAVGTDNAGDTLPAVTAADNGSVLSVVSGAWAKDGRVLEATGTTEKADDKDTFTLNVTAQALYEAALAGKLLHATIGEGASALDAVLPIEVFHNASGYIIKLRCDTNSADKFFMYQGNGSGETVTLTEV